MTEPTSNVPPPRAKPMSRYEFIRASVIAMAVAVGLFVIAVYLPFIVVAGKVVGMLAQGAFKPLAPTVQFVVTNGSDDDIVLKEFRFAEQRNDLRDQRLVVRAPGVKSVHYAAMFFLPHRKRVEEAVLVYAHASAPETMLTFGFQADRGRGWRQCRFVIVLRPEGTTASNCQRSELDDFDSP